MASSVRSLLALIACLIAGPLHAAVLTPFTIGQNSAAAGATTLVITTTAPVLPNQMIFVAAGQVGSATGAATTADSAGSAYGISGSVVGTLQKLFLFATSGQGNALGLASGGTITVTFPNNTAAHYAVAFCVPGLFVLNSIDISGKGPGATSASGSAVAQTPNATTFGPYEPELVATLLTAGAGDTWTESAGYTLIGSVLSTDALRVSYQPVPGLTPTPYAATNGAARAWTTINAPYRAQLCSAAATGAGHC